MTATSQLQQQLQNAVRCLESQGGQPSYASTTPQTRLSHTKKCASSSGRDTPLHLIKETRLRSTQHASPLEETRLRSTKHASPLEETRLRSTKHASPLEEKRLRSTTLHSKKRASAQRNTPLDSKKRASAQRNTPLHSPIKETRLLNCLILTRFTLPHSVAVYVRFRLQP
jgi:hypothetical protein